MKRLKKLWHAFIDMLRRERQWRELNAEKKQKSLPFAGEAPPRR